MQRSTRRIASILRVVGPPLLGALRGLFVVFILASLVFLTLRLVPGDPALLILGDQAHPADLARLRARLHFDEPLYFQYARFLKELATLDLGESIRRPGVSASARILDAMLPTSELAGLSVTLGALLGMGLGVLGAGPWLGRHAKWVERALVALAATPLLAFGPVLTMILAVRLRVVPLPGDPDSGFKGILFASSLLALPLAAQVGRITLAALSDIHRAQFLSVARAKGAGPLRVWAVHAIPAVSGPILTVIGTQLGALLGGAVVLERLFEKPGLGTLILEAYASRDFPVLQGGIIAAGFLFVATQSMTSAVHAWVDPRVGTQG